MGQTGWNGGHDFTGFIIGSTADRLCALWHTKLNLLCQLLSPPPPLPLPWDPGCHEMAELPFNMAASDLLSFSNPLSNPSPLVLQLPEPNSATSRRSEKDANKHRSTTVKTPARLCSKGLPVYQDGPSVPSEYTLAQVQGSLCSQ